MAAGQVDIKQTIKNTVNYLKNYLDVEKVILFGSYAAGKAGRFSDIDLAVVSPDFKKKKYEDILNIFAEASLSCGPNVELHPYTNEDLKDARPTNFLGFILKSGKIVFAKNKFNLARI